MRKSSILKEVENMPGAFEVTPREASPFIDKYFVATTLSKNQIYTIVGRTSFSNMESCLEQLGRVATRLKKKHGTPKHNRPNGPIFQLGDVRIQTNCDAIKGKPGVHMTISYTSEKWFQRFTQDLLIVK